jgi:hypothetical protein
VDRLIQSGKERLILDLTGVAMLDSVAFAALITMRRKLAVNLENKGQVFSRDPLFHFFQDQAQALEAIRRGVPAVLLLCGVSSQIRKLIGN